jgi:two-component system, NtrC family, response regulator AtoC
MELLIVDDDERIINAIKRNFKKDAINVLSANDGKDALRVLQKNQPDVIISDYMMPEMTGLEFIKAVNAIYSDIPVIVLTGNGCQETQTLFLKEGVFRYFEKPLNFEELKLAVYDAHKQLLLERNNKSMTLTLGYHESEEIIGKSPEMKKMFSLIENISGTDVSVLLQGESGTGKSLFARAIHKNSQHKDYPFVHFNCASSSEALVEAELFGYEKGAFTDAQETKVGRFELANHGTLFLDEVGELSLQIQAKLLRVLQEKQFERVGGIAPLTTTARIIAATNKDLAAMVSEGTFREDLYYRLNVFPITIPALRERTDDIEVLSLFFLKILSKRFHKNIKGFSTKALHCLKRSHWPGNIRELENVISRAIILCNESTITDEHLFLPQSSSQPKLIQNALEEELTETELTRLYAKEIYAKTKFSKTKTAKILGINSRTLLKRLE